MTVSVQQRTADIEQVLRCMMSELTEKFPSHPFTHVFFGETEFGEILRTTWPDMVELSLVSEHARNGVGNNKYSLTGRGWIMGLELMGQLDSPALFQTLINVRQCLKAQVKDRNHDVGAHVRTLATETALPIGVIQSIIEADLMGLKFPGSVGASWWSHKDRFQTVRIPSRFGMEQL